MHDGCRYSAGNAFVLWVTTGGYRVFARIFTGALTGIDAKPVTVEVDLSAGLPKLDIVGLPDAAVNQSRERVKAAIKNSGFLFPLKKVVINLAPANIRKRGQRL